MTMKPCKAALSRILIKLNVVRNKHLHLQNANNPMLRHIQLQLQRHEMTTKIKLCNQTLALQRQKTSLKTMIKKKRSNLRCTNIYTKSLLQRTMFSAARLKKTSRSYAMPAQQHNTVYHWKTNLFLQRCRTLLQKRGHFLLIQGTGFLC